jgi:hypothetical protein
MLSDGTPNGFGLSLALTNKTEIPLADRDDEEYRKTVEEERKTKLKQEVALLVNQIGKFDQPVG